MEEDDGNLSEFDDADIDKYIYTPEEALARQEIWEELNKDYLKELEGINMTPSFSSYNSL